jgi:hypothetical protein
MSFQYSFTLAYCQSDTWDVLRKMGVSKLFDSRQDMLNDLKNHIHKKTACIKMCKSFKTTSSSSSPWPDSTTPDRLIFQRVTDYINKTYRPDRHDYYFKLKLYNWTTDGSDGCLFGDKEDDEDEDEDEEDEENEEDDEDDEKNTDNVYEYMMEKEVPS